MPRQPGLFVGHGVPARLADPGDAAHAWLRRFAALLEATPPKAVLCVSAHWVTQRLTVTTGSAPPRLHEGGAESVGSTYAPRGDERIARRVIEALLGGGLTATGDDARGIDHGAWLPASILFGDAVVPVLQLSLLSSMDAETHFAIGRALESLRDEGILILGSGGVTNDMKEHARASAAGAAATSLPESSRRFETWVTDLITRSAPYARGRGLTRFRDHKDARAAHPTDEHFMPLLVVLGAASSDRSPENVGALVHAGCHLGLSTASYSFRR